MNRPEQNTQSEPITFYSRLSKDVTASTGFSNLPESEQRKLVSYIQTATTGEEAREHTDQVLAFLNGAASTREEHETGGAF